MRPLFIFVLVLMVLTPLNAEAYTLRTNCNTESLWVEECNNSSYQPTLIRLKRHCGLIHINFSSIPPNLTNAEVQQAFQSAAEKWRRATGGYIEFVLVGDTNDTRLGFVPSWDNNPNIVYFDDNWQYSPTTVARATTSISSTRLIGVKHDMRFNSKYYSFTSSLSVDNNGLMDLETIMLHEMGHWIGLQHSSDTTAVMYEGVYGGEVRRELTSDDIAGFNAMYSGHPRNNECSGFNTPFYESYYPDEDGSACSVLSTRKTPQTPSSLLLLFPFLLGFTVFRKRKKE